MKALRMILTILLTINLLPPIHGDNQTPETSPIFNQDSIPFEIVIEEADFSLPNGLQSYAYAVNDGKWLFFAGRTNGLHGFNNDPNNFPPQAQNFIAYVVDPISKTIASKSLLDPTSGLSQRMIDLLTVTASEYCQVKNTLYFIGGYGVDSETGTFSTKNSLLAINISGFMHWIENPSKGESAAQHIRETTHPLLQVTGGRLFQNSPHQPLLLIFGQNFEGAYLPGSNGKYTNQVRCFQIIDNGQQIHILPLKSEAPIHSFRRRDMNTTPIIQKRGTTYAQSYIQLSGVFTLSGGVWNVPVHISAGGTPSMADPLNPTTFKQGMNNYACPVVGLFSKSHEEMYILAFGGISYISYDGGVFVPDTEIPFINSVTTIKIDGNNEMTQHLMNNAYPVILSTFSNPGNPLLFGAGAEFIRSPDLPFFPNRVIQFDQLPQEPILLGHIVGGIQSTLPNTNTQFDSAASPYIFTVTLYRK